MVKFCASKRLKSGVVLCALGIVKGRFVRGTRTCPRVGGVQAGGVTPLEWSLARVFGDRLCCRCLASGCLAPQ